jgi:hypothetical protein
MGHALAQQALQDAMQQPERHLGRDEVFDQRRVRLLERFDHLLHVLAPEELGGVDLERLHEVRGDHDHRLHDHIA